MSGSSCRITPPPPSPWRAIDRLHRPRKPGWNRRCRRGGAGSFIVAAASPARAILTTSRAPPQCQGHNGCHRTEEPRHDSHAKRRTRLAAFQAVVVVADLNQEGEEQFSRETGIADRQVLGSCALYTSTRRARETSWGREALVRRNSCVLHAHRGSSTPRKPTLEHYPSQFKRDEMLALPSRASRVAWDKQEDLLTA